MTDGMYVALELILLTLMIIVVNSRVSGVVKRVNRLQGDVELTGAVLLKMLKELGDDDGFSEEDNGKEE